MPTTLMPVPKQQYFGIAGLPLVAGNIYTYAAGTNNPKQTFTDSAGTIAQPNPIPLNARGEPTSAIYWSGAYKVVIRDALDNIVYTVDNYNTDPAGVWNVFATFLLSTGSSLIGFIQAGVGAILRTAQDKQRERVTFEDYGAIGNGIADDILAIEKAITAHPGKIWPLNKVYGVSRTIKLKSNRILDGEGPGSYNPVAGVQRVTTIKPLAGFVGTAVISMDPANEGNDVYAYGNGISNLTIDMSNVSGLVITAIDMRSVSNAETFANLRVINQDKGTAVYIGISANVGALQSDGVVLDNLYTVSNAIEPADLSPGVVIYRANEITIRDSKITRRSNGNPAAGSIGVHVYADAAGTVNDVRLINSAVAGYETGHFVEAKAGAGQGPRWVRSFGAAFESVKFGFRFVGTPTAPTQFHTVISARQQSTRNGGALVWLDDYACNSNITVEEFAGVSINGGVASLVICAAQSQGNLINAQLSGVINNGIANAVIGRRGDAFEISKLYREPTIVPPLLNGWANGSPSNRSNAGYWKDALGVVHLQGYLSGGAFGGGAGNSIMLLPVGYRTVNGAEFAVATTAGTAGLILITPDGYVYPLAGAGNISLDNITFPTY